MRRTLLGYALMILTIAGIWALDAYAIPWTDAYMTSILIRIGINVLAVMGLSLVLGFTGQFSLGHAGFMALGAYSAAYVSIHPFQSESMNLYLAAAPMTGVLLGGACAALGGLVVGLPSLRLSGDYLAVVTLGFNGIIIVVIQNMQSLGAALGMIGLPHATSFGWTYTWLLLGVLFLRNLLASAHGRTFMAVRDNEIAVRSLGINTTSAKVVAFVVGAFWAGVAGGLLAFLNSSVSPGQFTYDRSIELVAMVVLGGTGSLSGPAIAAVVLTALPEVLRPIAQYRMVIYAMLLIVMMIVRPQGLMGRLELSDVVRRLFKKRKPTAAESSS